MGESKRQEATQVDSVRCPGLASVLCLSCKPTCLGCKQIEPYVKELSLIASDENPPFKAQRSIAHKAREFAVATILTPRHKCGCFISGAPSIV